MASGKETERSSHAGRQSPENFQNSYWSNDHQLMRTWWREYTLIFDRTGKSLWKYLPCAKSGQKMQKGDIFGSSCLSQPERAMIKTVKTWSAAEKSWTFIKLGSLSDQILVSSPPALLNLKWILAMNEPLLAPLDVFIQTHYNVSTRPPGIFCKRAHETLVLFGGKIADNCCLTTVFQFFCNSASWESWKIARLSLQLPLAE